MSEKTEWYPVSINPIRDGVYETRIFVGEDPAPFQRFENGRWFSTCDTVQEAADCPFFSAIADCIKDWRGLTEPTA